MPSSATPSPSRPYSALKDYQQNAIDHLYRNDAAIIQAKMGAGKHVIGQTAIQELIEGEVLSRVLVATTPRVRDNVWAVEHKVWEHLWTPAIANGPPASRSLILEDRRYKIAVISLDVLPWAADKYNLPELFDGFLIDELTKVKAPTGSRIRAMRKHLPHFTWRAALTGTLGGDGNIEDIFGQVQWLSNVLGRNVTAFRQRYETLTDPEFHKYEPKPGAWEKVIELIRPLVYQVDDAAYQASLPAIVPVPTLVTMPRDTRRLYNTMKRSGVIVIDGVEVVAEDLGARKQKLQQLASGFIYNEGETILLDNAKLDALGDILEQQTSPVIVAYQFTAELEAMRSRFPAPAMGNGETADVEAWNAGEIPLLYMHPRSAAHGLNLQAGGNALVFFAQTWSRDDHDQLIARLRRRGQAERQVWVHYLLAENSVDGEVVDRVEAKQRVESGLLDQL